MTLATLAATTVVWAGFFSVQLFGVHSNDLGYLDLLVYRAGGHAVITGHSIYAPDFAAVNQSPNGLSFTYPPFSAVIFAPLAIVPPGVAKVLIVALNAVASMIFFVVIVLAVQNEWDRLRSWRSLTAPISVQTGMVVWAAAVIFVFSVPVQDNTSFGQVNLILAAAVALDTLLPSVPWPRGLLVGLAAAIKLTPAVFVGYFLVTRQWRALVVSLATAALAVATSWLVIPSDTIRYFMSTVFDPARIGGLAFASNQSVRGVIERIPALDSMRGAIWVTATVLVLALAIAAIDASRRSKDTVAAMLSAAFIGLVCSPVSWGHHWVWLPATVVYFLVRWSTVGGARNLVAGLAVASVTVVAPWKFLPNSDERERLWTPLQHVLGSVWAITALLVLASFAMAPAVRRAAAKAPAVTYEAT